MGPNVRGMLNINFDEKGGFKRRVPVFHFLARSKM